MPNEGKKIGEVTVAIMEDLEGHKYLHATGDGMFDYLTVWNEMLSQAREEGREEVRKEHDTSGDN